MEDKTYVIEVEKYNRIEILLLVLFMNGLAFGTSYWLEEAFGIRISGEIILLIYIVGVCVLLTKFQRFFQVQSNLPPCFTRIE